MAKKILLIFQWSKVRMIRYNKFRKLQRRKREMQRKVPEKGDFLFSGALCSFPRVGQGVDQLEQ